jgi:hypothetical protein
MQGSGDFLSQNTLRVLLEIKARHLNSIQPVFDDETGIYYESLKGFSQEDQVKVLELLAREKIAIPTQVASVLSCKSCASFRFHNNYVCNLCKSINLVRGKVIRHIPCNNTDFDYNFDSANGLECKKCNKSLKAIGVDYMKQGTFFKCLDCNSLLPETQLRFTCARCGKHEEEDGLDLTKIFAYDLDQERLAAFCKESDYVMSIIDELSKAGVSAIYQGGVTGRSKVLHRFSLVIHPVSKQAVFTREFAVVDFVSHHGDSNQAVLAEITKFVDVASENKILVTIPKLNDDGRALATEYGIRLIESDTLLDARTRVVQFITNELESGVESKPVNAE